MTKWANSGQFVKPNAGREQFLLSLLSLMQRTEMASSIPIFRSSLVLPPTDVMATSHADCAGVRANSRVARLDDALFCQGRRRG